MTPAASHARAPAVWAALAVVYLVWGSTFAALRVMVETVPPWLGGGARFVLAGVLMLGWALARGGRGRLRVSRRELASCAAVGLLLVTLANGLITAAERDAPSALAALVAATMPLWVVVLRRLHGERPPAGTLAAVPVGLGGVALLLLPGGAGGAAVVPLLVVAVAALCWACGAQAGRLLPVPGDLVPAVALQMMIGGAGSLAVGLALGEPGDLRAGRLTLDSAVAWGYLVVAGSVLAFSAYAWLLRNAPPSLVATHGYVNPLVAVAIGWLALGEAVGPFTIAAAAAIVASVAMTVASPGRGRAGGRGGGSTRPPRRGRRVYAPANSVSSRANRSGCSQ